MTDKREIATWSLACFVGLWILLVSVDDWSLWGGAAAAAPVVIGRIALARAERKRR